MTPVHQTIVSSTKGNCLQAAFASLFDCTLEDVPHFILIDDMLEREHAMQRFVGEVTNQEWTYRFKAGGGAFYSEDDNVKQAVSEAFYFDHTIGVVPSLNRNDCLHAIIIDRTGLVVHDPTTKNSYLGRNVVEEKIIESFYIFRKFII